MGLLCSVTSVVSDFMVCTLPGSSVPGLLQARTLERVAMASSRGSSQPRDCTQVSALQVDSLPSEPPGKPHVGLMSHDQGDSRAAFLSGDYRIIACISFLFLLLETSCTL